ncbi:response regulator [Lonepinella sp. MS14437]|uniref:response regulator n=1 Tax=Lonepinella sp. MS14437 TaxID=3003620 RepID=UPI0036DA543C
MPLLLVDDDQDIRSLLADLLSLEGFHVDEAENGKVALEKLAENSYRLILLDIMMPVMDGIETLKEIHRLYNTPVLMLTARGDDSDRIQGLELGADDYLAKPFNDRELIARIRAILRRTDTNVALNTQNIINFEGLILNTATKQASYKGKSLELTATEFGCLELIVSQVNLAVSRDDLSLKVLGKPLSPYDRSIDVHMSNLRKKLPPRENNDLWFRTLRGRGYVMLSDEYCFNHNEQDENASQDDKLGGGVIV